MTYNNGVIYYVLNNEVFSLQNMETSLPENSLFELGSNAYGLAVSDNKLYVANANFTSTEDNSLLIYDLNTNSEIHRFELPLGPSKIYFN